MFSKLPIIDQIAFNFFSKGLGASHTDEWYIIQKNINNFKQTEGNGISKETLKKKKESN